MTPLKDIPTGARVRSPKAAPFDFAYQRVGTVVRETINGEEYSGVRWDGGDAAYEYPPEWIMIAEKGGTI